MVKKFKFKIFAFAIASIVILGFFSYYAVGFYKQNIGPEYCVKKDTGLKMKRSEALRIAKQSECMKEGKLSPLGYECNEYTGIWWLDLNVFNEKSGCSPACVVDITTKDAVINWRCTGFNP